MEYGSWTDPMWRAFHAMRMRGWGWCLLLLLLSAPAGMAQDAMDHDLLEVTVPQLQQMYRDHKYTVTQVVQWYLARIAKYNGIYRAVQNVDRLGALATAAREDAEATPHGALWGIPIVTKANTSVKGLVTTDGWRGYIIPGHELVAPKDADIVARLRAAGAIIVGQTNMPDFAASDTNRSTAFGRTGNAYDVRFSPGGSSGGTVTAVTANFAVLGNGTDTGNSIRMPSATSSVVGVFPSRGLVSIAGIAPLDWLLDNTGPIARDVTDATIALDAVAEPNPKAERGPYTSYLKADALSVIQCDPEWCGGTSELMKICTLASVFDVPVIPHGHSLHAALHLIASQSPAVCPLAEYLILKMRSYYHFEKHAPAPTRAHFTLTDAPGYGIELDDSKIESRQKMHWS